MSLAKHTIDSIRAGLLAKQFSAEELNDPLNRQVLANEKAEYDAYQAELEKAEKLGIPIMNQNRFLYFCGYYNSAQR